MLKKAILLFPILCMLVIMVSCGGNPIIPSVDEENNIQITDMFWDSNTKIIEITLDPFPSTWGNWTMYIDSEKLSMEGGAGNPVIRPNASLDELPTGLIVGTLPWVSPLNDIDFPCCGTLQFNIPGEGFTNEYEFNLINFGCETASEEECTQTPIPSPESSDDFILIQVKDLESNIIFIAGGENEETIVILGEKNNQGDPTKITGTIYVSELGYEFYIEAGIDGLPTYIIDYKGNKITFENYTNSTVDVAFYDSNENLIEGPNTIDVDPEDLLAIKDLLAIIKSHDSFHSQPKYLNPFYDSLDWGIISFDDLIPSIPGFDPPTQEGNLKDTVEALLKFMGNAFSWISSPEGGGIMTCVTILAGDPCFPPFDSPGCDPVWDIIADIYEDEESTQNHPPVISDLSADPPSVDFNQATTITCFASDPDGDPLTYHWTKNGGAFVGSTSGLSVTWRAPSTEGNYSVECEVSDGEGGEDSESINIVVTESEEPSGIYALRDIGPAGGYIFYDKGSYSNGWRYLEAAPASTEWTHKEWGGWGTLIGGTETGIGIGQSNTTKIVTWLNSHSETGKAAQLCDALVYGGYSDWFLPSLDELNLMYENLIIFGVGGFPASGDYWSSSEHLTYFSFIQRFSSYDTSSMQLAAKKTDTNRVRAVRAF